ncbi:MAG: hypothetical protein AB1806_10680 [Acidobacteriota bacterium]
MTDTSKPSLLRWIADNPGWAALGTFATLLALLVFFVDLAYRSQIEDMRRKIQDREGEVASLAKANRELQARLMSPTTRPASSPDSGAGRAIGDQPFGTTSLRLVKGQLAYFWDGQGRLLLLNTYQSLGNASVEGYLGEDPIRWDLYVNRRDTFSFRGVLYYVDLSEVGFDSAVLSIREKELP